MSPRHTSIRKNILAVFGCCAVALALVGCAVRGDVADWSRHGMNADETRFSPLASINRDTVSRLGLAWSLDLPQENDLEATPLEVDGVLYFSGGMSTVYAVAVDTGKLLWTYDPKTGQALTNSRRIGLPVNRGVAYQDGLVYVATRDGRMIAIDAKTGKPKWTTEFLFPDDNSFSTGAPRVCGTNVIIGNAGSESASRGYVTAMNRETGKISWRFFIVPGNPAVDKDETTRLAAKTWGGEWWKHGGGGNPWNGMTCDESLGQFLIGTGNGAPWSLDMRSNGIQDNLFLASMVAVDIETGKYKWHYQYNPGEQWDWKAVTDIALANMEIDGKPHQVALQAPSNGFFYVIDRTNGKLLSAKDYGKQNWAKYIDLKSGRPVETGIGRYGTTPVTLYPGPGGTHNWHSMAVNTDTMTAYIPYMQVPLAYAKSQAERDKAKAGKHAGFTYPGIANDLPAPSTDPMDGRGSLIAWNIAEQKIVWRVDHPSFWNSGVVTTKGGLVFQGLEDGHLVAYDAANGKRLWSFDAGLGIMAPPITYSYKGKQYVSVLVGYGGSGGNITGPLRKASWLWGEQTRRLLTFALDAKAKLPPNTPRTEVDSTPPIVVPNLKLDPARVAEGGELYNYSCSYCHFSAGMGAGSGPNLLTSGIAADRQSFRQLLREGILRDRGMPMFADLSDQEVESLYQFLRFNAQGAAAGPVKINMH